MITLTASCLFGRMRLAGAGSRPKYATYSVKLLLVNFAFLRDPRERDRGGGDEPAKACECVRFLDGRLLPAGCMISRTYSMVWSSGGSTTALRLLTCCGRAEVFYWLSIFWQLKVIKKSQATKLYGAQRARWSPKDAKLDHLVATRSSVITCLRRAAKELRSQVCATATRYWSGRQDQEHILCNSNPKDGLHVQLSLTDTLTKSHLNEDRLKRAYSNLRNGYTLS